ncbi:preprotein translocase subunit YajC [Micrococcus luteus]|jgi:preprotein translocase subunit YajC|uniref:Preprotein translocase subunit YajC n=1 Tax=Micrococcus luteus (strain ATCC 4698 / DSM 20030 / JCM 1464 / CCM 169 / CCUG 5858 / IAM 1056 / NBRC 3333 / NCIMB 9278 / NCTC 2665 / VKM Ac-2230) TaxID=465515 RepID=C5CCI0_MICLC|nr:preprotein translocase subunit YajC [Micrococcus luteus]ACS30792.1 preprotein translocase, YajC subunit [Micrococcus luteus NCTC 2665]AJO55882.1 preprotein translocase subunit YajC [Micrococcus luteus]KAB1901391.1 preprotein translocase subunit YajC [Micrococcus luteus NCTC 2665]ORE59178.1 preprotein translocase subunit YajC [Micrococcus luteus]QCY45314.1 preprotein translocase subunit YajC [Micrococcus luteus]
MPVATAATLPVIAQQAQGGGGSLLMLVAFAVLAVMLFLSFRRGKKVQQQQAQMRSTLAPGDEVMTGAGIFGTVVAVDTAGQRVTLETAPGTRMDVHLQGVTTVVEPETAEAPAGVDPAAAPTTDPSRLDDAPGTEYRVDDAADPRPRRDDLA